MTSPFPIDAPELIGVGAEAIVERSKHLGLVWTRRMATVVSADDPPNSVIMFDGDSVEESAVSMMGIIPTDTRVYVDIIPPGGNFIVGLTTQEVNPAFFGASSTTGLFSPGGTTTSATYVNLPGPPTVTLTKAYTTTRLLVTLTATLTSTLANTSVRFAVNTTAGDTDIAQLVINPASTHLQVAGTTLITLASSGSVTLTGRWRRVAGGGTLTTGTDDWFSMSALEVAPA